jgi:hypothetical protein
VDLLASWPTRSEGRRNRNEIECDVRDASMKAAVVEAVKELGRWTS